MGCTKDLSCHIFLAVVVDVVTELARKGTPSELLYAHDIGLMSEKIEGLRKKFLEWKEFFESKGFKFNLGSGGIIKDDMSRSKVDPCGVCNLRTKANSALCLQCGKWIHARWAGVNRMTPKF